MIPQSVPLVNNALLNIPPLLAGQTHAIPGIKGKGGGGGRGEVDEED